MVIHDPTVDRTTNGRGNVSDMTLEELRSLNAGNGERIPLFSEVLSLVSALGGIVLADVKEPGLEPEVAEVAELMGLTRHLIVDSFHRKSIGEFKAEYPWIPAAVMLWPGLNYGNGEDPVDIAVDLGVEYLHMCLPRDVTQDLVDRAHQHDVKVIAGTTDDPSEIERLVAIGVDALTPNDPTVTCRLLTKTLHNNII